MAIIPRLIIPSVRPAPLVPDCVETEFRGLLKLPRTQFLCAGEATSPARLLSAGYVPRHKIELFRTTFYLSDVRENEHVRFFVAYVVQSAGARTRVSPRIFYKDVSLIWRAASHYVHTSQETWIGKGDVQTVMQDGEEFIYSAEHTTDLPIEIQGAVESLIRAVKRIPYDMKALALVLRKAPADRIEAYRDFTEPRRRARLDKHNLVNGGRSIASFRRHNDPRSLVFVAGYEPDFDTGVVEVETSTSKLYGGRLKRFRILSRNRLIQYLFFKSPRHAWIIPPQATTTELSSYGVRTIDVVCDEDLCVPGFEYHYMDGSEDPPVLVSQIPEGFIGKPNRHDPTRADASAWIERLPVIKEFRKKVLGGRQSRALPVKEIHVVEA